jgi:hypothetical protein
MFHFLTKSRRNGNGFAPQSIRPPSCNINDEDSHVFLAESINVYWQAHTRPVLFPEAASAIHRQQLPVTPSLHPSCPARQ